MFESRDDRSGAPSVPPFPEGLVADLHAGVLDDETAAELWPAVLADPDGAALVRLLDAVRAGLADLADPSAPEPHAMGAPAREVPAREAPVPEQVSARLRRALLAASAEPDGGEGAATVARLRPRRRRALVTAVAAAVVATVLIAAPTIWMAARGGDGSSATVAADASLPSTPTPARQGAVQTGSAPGSDSGHASRGSDRPAGRTSEPLTPAQILAVDGQDDPGPFSDPSRLAACLTANGLTGHSRLLGSGPVEVDGRTATLLLLPGPHPPMLTGLVVTGACGRHGTGLLYRTDIGG